MATLTVGARVHHVVADLPDDPRGHRSGIVRSVDSDGLITVEWTEVAPYLQHYATGERNRVGAYVNRMHPSLLVAF